MIETFVSFNIFILSNLNIPLKNSKATSKLSSTIRKKNHESRSTNMPDRRHNRFKNKPVSSQTTITKV